MGDDKRGWRRLQAIKVTKKDFRRHARKAEGATLRHAHKFIVKRWDNIRSVRRRIVLWMVGVATLIVVVGLQMLWFQRSYMATELVSGGTYAEAVRGPLQTLNPLYATTDAEVATSRLLFSSLYAHDTSGSLRPDTAASMKVDDTGKVYTLLLRPDVHWQDGRALTAKDVEFTVNLMKNPSTRSVMSASWQDVGVEAHGEYVVVFTLPAAYASFPQALTFAILPEHILRDVNPVNLRESTYSSNPVGSGPFALRFLQTINASSDRKVAHLQANERYHYGRPALDRLQLHVYGDDDAVGTALKTGEVHAASNVASRIAETVDTDRYTVLKKPVNSGVYALFNTSSPTLKSLEVRRALQAGTNTAALRSALYAEPQKLELPFIDDMVQGGDVPSAPAFNAARAGELLDDAGWRKGEDGIREKDGEKLQLRIVTRQGSEYERIIELLSGQWHRLGVSVASRVVDPASANANFAQTLQQRDYDVLVDTLYIGGDPDVFAYWHTRGQLNFSNYSNAVADDALAGARARATDELRNVKYKAFAKQWLSDVPAIGLYQSSALYVQNNSVRALTDDETLISAPEHYSNVLQWRAERKQVYKTP